MARIAETIAEATHRFPTEVLWGEGYFGDLMRYLVAASDDDALQHPRAIAAGTEMTHMQCRDGNRWRFCSKTIEIEA